MQSPGKALKVFCRRDFSPSSVGFRNWGYPRLSIGAWLNQLKGHEDRADTHPQGRNPAAVSAAWGLPLSFPVTCTGFWICLISPTFSFLFFLSLIFRNSLFKIGWVSSEFNDIFAFFWYMWHMSLCMPLDFFETSFYMNIGFYFKTSIQLVFFGKLPCVPSL